MNSDSRKNYKKGGDKHGLERREFIKLGAGGVAASLTACAAPMLTDQILDSPAKTQVPVPAAPVNKPAIPEVNDDLIDPAITSSESWQEPWTWRPEEWPDQRLQLNVVRNQNPGLPPSPASFGGAVFSYGGISPAPTIRVPGDGIWKLKIRNTLGLNAGEIEIGPGVNHFDLPPKLKQRVCNLMNEQLGVTDPEDPTTCRRVSRYPEQIREITGAETLPNWNIGGHVNGIHATHTTNLHTHGLHVQPEKNDDGSHSDNVHLRIIPRADYEMRKQQLGDNPQILKQNEHVAELDYDIHLGFQRNGKPMLHPPGTHWYHPHSHGATHAQVASGMAGFLIVEGDVDTAINRAMTGQEHPNPEEKTGLFDYRERQIFLQRVFVIAGDTDAKAKRNNLRFPPFLFVNGRTEPTVIKMRPGAVERWRVINGSIDGAGTKRFMVLEGQFLVKPQGPGVQIFRVDVDVTTDGKGEGQIEVRNRRFTPVTEQDLEDAKVDIQQLSVDGITLVVEENGTAVHRIRDLSRRNAGTQNPIAAKPRLGESQPKAALRGIEDCFRDGDSLSRAFVRPNEVLMTNANRTDLIFKAPVGSAGKVFTIFAKESLINGDTHQSNLQMINSGPTPNVRRPQLDDALAYIHVDGEPVEGGEFDIQSLNDHMPPVPPLLLPVGADELRVPRDEAAKTGVPSGSLRTRTVAYSGTGGTDLPILELPPGFAEKHSRLKDRLWAEVDGVQMVMPPSTATMGINPEFDLKLNPNPGPARKFSAEDPQRSRMLIDTAEEWVVYNNSMTMFSHTDLERYPQPGSYDGVHFIAYPISRTEGQQRYVKDPEFQISVKGTDHPFHIHINPMWVLRIDVPDENGNLHNILPEPCWMDVAAIPRNGGRIVFRSRFDDFVGTWIHHCHILAHEDNGMMQMIECVDRPEDSNYHPRNRAASHAMSGSQVDAIYPKPSRELMYTQTLTFVDPSPIGGYEFPGFELEVPILGDD
jgi:FtsP/CotA-like multicopper oxidase with cupredoxin domain